MFLREVCLLSLLLGVWFWMTLIAFFVNCFRCCSVFDLGFIPYMTTRLKNYKKLNGAENLLITGLVGVISV